MWTAFRFGKVSDHAPEATGTVRDSPSTVAVAFPMQGMEKLPLTLATPAFPAIT
jgi:hypothetical protein